jgi:hypothetical protein
MPASLLAYSVLAICAASSLVVPACAATLVPLFCYPCPKPHLDELCLQVLLAKQADVLVHHLQQQQKGQVIIVKTAHS